VTVATIAATARALIRDFPQFYEVDLGPLDVLTVRLPHPLVSPASVQVYSITGDPPVSTPTSDWLLDERNGLLKFTDQSLLNTRILTSGYYYTWFADTDLLLHASQAANEALYNTTGSVDSISGVYAEVVAIGTVVRALWSLATELSLDIDVSTPEGMFIPARQRYTQIMQMVQYWEGEYATRASALNIGLGALEVFRLRRVAYLTNRYVPVYAEREFDDPRRPERLYPPIPDGTINTSPTPDDIIEVTEALEPGFYRGRP
jgi:hypothetical protein